MPDCERNGVHVRIAVEVRMVVCGSHENGSHRRLWEPSFQARESSFYARELLVSEIWITWDLCKAVFEWKFVALFFLFFLYFFSEISYLLTALAKRKTYVTSCTRIVVCGSRRSKRENR